MNEMDIGFIVDETDAVTNISDENISPPPKLSDDQTHTFLTGVATVERRVEMLSTNKFLLEDALTILINAQV